MASKFPITLEHHSNGHEVTVETALELNNLVSNGYRVKNEKKGKSTASTSRSSATSTSSSSKASDKSKDSSDDSSADDSANLADDSTTVTGSSATTV